MEHKLIRGGEQYLPFARSRIKQLRSTGQAYASDKFVLDGVTVKVWIEPDHDYIDINGGGNDLLMDSGVVELDSWDLFGDGILHECTGVSGYNAAFTHTGAKYRTNPDHSTTGESGQLSGKLSFSGRFSGSIPVSTTANSFKAWQIPDVDNPGQYKRDTADAALLAKSNTARQVPASVFTGRTRMFVQAMYGLWLHPTRKTTNPAPTAVYGNYAAPYLQLANYKGGGDKTSYPNPLDLTTSSGVYFDPVQGKHWLIEAPNSNDFITLYPLVATREREALRKYLRTGAKKVLSDAAKTHLEAYILSTALPDRAHKQIITLTGNTFPTSPTALGYGWHFNWSGTEATIVKLGQFDQGHTADGEAFCMTSTVYTLDIQIQHSEEADQVQTTPPAFTAQLVHTGPTNWYSLRGLWEFTQAAFDTLGQDKILPPVSIPFAHGAVPFYAFYNKDSLQLCTIAVANVGVTTNVFTGSEHCSAPNRAGCPTIGQDDGWGQTLTTPQYWTATIAVGDTVYGTTCTNHTQSKTRFEIGEKVGVVPPVIAFGTNGGGLGGSFNANQGYPIQLTPTMAWNTVFFGPNYNGGGPVAWKYAYSETAYTSSIENRGGLVCMTPVYDAEALLVWASWTTIETKTGTKKHYADYSSWQWSTSYHQFPGWEDPGGNSRISYYHWDSAGSGTLITTDTVNTVETNALDDGAELITAKTHSAATLNIAPFFADFQEDLVQGGGLCVSNVSGNSAIVVRSAALSVDRGLPGITSADLAIVGWA